jgi:hypothetical protein
LPRLARSMPAHEADFRGHCERVAMAKVAPVGE